LRSLASTVNKSTTVLLPAWKQHLSDLNMPERMLRQDVCTRWQSTNDMVVNAVRMKRAVRSFCTDGDLGVDLDKFRMNTREWQIAEQLVDVLKDATQFFSRGTPNLAAVIPAMDVFDQELTTKKMSGSRDSNRDLYDPAIRHAHRFAQQVLNKYYALTDSSEAYCIAMSE
ncbi:uncharacterized protein BXZ73DRAFT_53981, partial [Epithele typhae]|uniref:uncharacterized protein n=1 Tax=Epithele typhae TaxID=378194 RepID=UPI0020087832